MQCLASKTSSIKSSNGFLRLDDLDPDMDNTNRLILNMVCGLQQFDTKIANPLPTASEPQKMAVTIAPCGLVHCFTKRRRDPEETEDFNEISMHVENNSVRMVTLILSFFFFLCYVGMETTFGGLIMTFAVEYAHWTKPQGAIVTAIFWGCELYP
jgi:hypothetical protein